LETGTASKLVFVDASVLINFLHLDRLDLLGSFKEYRFAVPEEVEEEILWPELTARLKAARESGHITVEPTTDLKEISRIGDLRQVMGRGEAACLAMAEHRQGLIASDERGRFLREAQEGLGLHRVLDTPGLMLLAIRRGLLDVDAANRLKACLERHRFKMRFASFDELI
jgi:predicted nucleic acid-binding protein